MLAPFERYWLTLCALLFGYWLVRDVSSGSVLSLSASLNGASLDIRLPWAAVDATFLTLNLSRLYRLLRRDADVE